MVGRYAVISSVGGAEIVENIVKAAPEYASKMGWIPADGLEIGMERKDGAFKKPKEKRAKINALRLLDSLSEPEVDALIDALTTMNVISSQKGERLKGK
jgi:hypothetical protein